MRSGEVLASAEIAEDARARRRGLLGRSRIEGALVLRPCRQVHTIGMQVPIDVIWCDRDGRVLRVATMRPWRVSRVVWRARFVIEAEAGASARWKLALGDTVEVSDNEAGER